MKIDERMSKQTRRLMELLNEFADSKSQAAMTTTVVRLTELLSDTYQKGWEDCKADFENIQKQN